jgi:3-oxoacyl-[acyl-carrier-protein] synthase-1
MVLALLAGLGAAPDQHWHIGVLLEGRTGLGTALLEAARMLALGECSQVLVLGVDSYLNAADIGSLLHEGRLFVPGNRNGFIPGEAASAVLLRPAPLSAPGLHVRGVGVDHEAGRHDGSVPSRGQGLSRAIRAACEMASLTPAALQFRASDHNGEQFFANEASNAVTRVMFGSGADLAHLTLADKLGEVGAAAGVAMLAWLWAHMGQREWSPGACGMLHLASEGGARCAVVLHHVQEQ